MAVNSWMAYGHYVTHDLCTQFTGMAAIATLYAMEAVHGARPPAPVASFAGLDFGLTMVAELRDRTYAECCQLMSEYDPHPPFNAGSMKTAHPQVRAPTGKMLVEFTKKAEALAAGTPV